MRRFLLLALLACACGSAGAPDAGPVAVDAESCLYGMLPTLGTLPSDGGCRRCQYGSDELERVGDEECRAAYGPILPAGCTTFCVDGHCRRRCQGECIYYPDGGCETGTGQCDWSQTTGSYVCDPTCAGGGACQGCATDAECEAELGSGAVCQRHCVTCCRPSDVTELDGGVPCSCS